MEFLNKKDKKIYKKILANSISRKKFFKTRKLIINYVKTNVNVYKVKTMKDLLEHCGLSNEYSSSECFVILAKKFLNTNNFKLSYIGIFCTLQWKVKLIKIINPNDVISHSKEFEYVFLMAPNLANYFQIKINDFIRT